MTAMSVKLFEVREDLDELRQEADLQDTRENAERLRRELQQVLDARD